MTGRVQGRFAERGSNDAVDDSADRQLRGHAYRLISRFAGAGVDSTGRDVEDVVTSDAKAGNRANVGEFLYLLD
jgi:hypothetical protein